MTNEEKILDLLKNSNNGLPYKEILEKTEIIESELSFILEKLEQGNKITRLNEPDPCVNSGTFMHRIKLT